VGVEKLWQRPRDAADGAPTVEIARLPNGQVALRRSADPMNRIIFEGDEWELLMASIRVGDFG